MVKQVFVLTSFLSAIEKQKQLAISLNGEKMKLDIHNHILPETWPDLKKVRKFFKKGVIYYAYILFEIIIPVNYQLQYLD